MPILVDTGILYALADRDDAWHGRVKKYLEEARELLVVPVTVVPETAYLLHTRLGPRAERAFIRSLAAGELAVEALGGEDLVRSVEILGKFPKVGFVDASVVAIAERLRVDTLATTDRRDFSLLRPKHVARLHLVP